MTREDQVLALLGDANPVPDVEDFVQSFGTRLRDADNWSGDMQDTLGRETHQKIRGRRRWLKPAAAAAAILIIVVGTAGIWNAVDDSPVAASPSVAAAILYLETASSGDIDALYALRSPEMAGPFPIREQVYANLNNRFTVGSCRDIPSSSIGPIVQCDVVETNDFVDPSGVEFSYVMTLQFDDELELVALDRGADLTDVFAYARAFWVWLRQTYPDVYADLDPWDLVSLPGWNTDAADAFVALEYVDEFVAQSDVYPLTGG